MLVVLCLSCQRAWPRRSYTLVLGAYAPASIAKPWMQPTVSKHSHAVHTLVTLLPCGCLLLLVLAANAGCLLLLVLAAFFCESASTSTSFIHTCTKSICTGEHSHAMDATYCYVHRSSSGKHAHTNPTYHDNVTSNIASQ